MSSSMEKVTLKSSDGEVFKLELAVAEQSVTIKHMIEDGCANDVIPLPNVTGATMAKVIEYSRKHAEANAKELSPDDKAALKKWDEEFARFDQSTLYHLILAANYLNNKSLLELMCQTLANMIKGKTPEEIRRTFNIVNDFTPEKEADVRRENQWAFGQS